MKEVPMTGILLIIDLGTADEAIKRKTTLFLT